MEWFLGFAAFIIIVALVEDVHSKFHERQMAKIVSRNEENRYD